MPYITEVETNLSILKKKNPSVYTRTALGHYSVASNEEVKINGFNLDNYTVDISKISFLFPTNMYSNAYGSVVVSAYILSENKEKYDKI